MGNIAISALDSAVGAMNSPAKFRRNWGQIAHDSESRNVLLQTLPPISSLCSLKLFPIILAGQLEDYFAITALNSSSTATEIFPRPRYSHGWQFPL